MSIVVRIAVAATLAVSLSWPCLASADEPADYSTVESTLSNTKYSVGLLGGRGTEVNGHPKLEFTEVYPSVAFPVTDVVGRSFYRGVLEYKVEGVLGVATNKNDKGIAGLCPVGLRYSFTTAGGRLVPYVEGTLGAVYLNVPKTIQGTRFNFVENAAAGLKYFATDRVALDVQVRFRHLSNANIRRPNPGLDTIYVVVGLGYY